MDRILRHKVDKIVSILGTLYPNPPVPLNFTSAFQCLVAVVLSAQTTDGKVNEVTKELFRVAPTPQLLAQMKPEAVEQIIKTVGLAPSKSRYVVNLSHDLITKFKGEVPGNYKDLESLPGVGHKTASCVMNHVFDEPSIAVDTHVHRCALRWGLTKETGNPTKVQEDLYAAFPQKHWKALNLQIIYYGREYCTAKNHVPSECPICHHLSPKQMALEMDQVGLAASPLPDLSPFSPKKTGKGIVTYGGRHEELSPTPQGRAAAAAARSRPDPSLAVKLEHECAESKGETEVQAVEGDSSSGGKRKASVVVTAEAAETKDPKSSKYFATSLGVENATAASVRPKRTRK
jgi:endonuclease III